MWKRIRIGALLLILVSVASSEWLEQQRLWAWRHTTTVALYPIAGDDSPATARYVRSLSATDYADIERFFADEAKRYALPLEQPIRIELYQGTTAPPPAPPFESRGLGVVWWSLKLRYYAWRASHAGDGPIRIFVIFHDGRRLPTLPHSLGLQRGHIGVVHAFAVPFMAGSNNVIIAHELLHTLGATDRYDLSTDLPLIPDGLGDPNQQPLYPQDFAEIMAGRRLVAPGRAEIPVSLSECLIGAVTAREIHWVHD